MKSVLIILCGLLLALATFPTWAAPAQPLWVTAYYPVWHQQDGTFLPDKIDFTAISELIHFAVTPKPDGTIDDTPAKTITPAQSAAVIGPAHAAGRKVLLCVGGADTAPLFHPVLTDAVRPRFITSLVSMVTARGYDGLDIDMEPIVDADVPLYPKFIQELRTALNAAKPGLLLTAATAQEPAMFAGLQSQFDQINLMTYDLSGPWEGFSTWYNAALHGDGTKMMSGSVPYPSVDGTLGQFIQAGIAPRKLGLGVAFYGDVWTGATAARQSIQGTTSDQLAYSDIMDKYYQPSVYHWDDVAKAPYLSIAAPNAKDQKFITYDDERLCAAKVVYARQHGLGGLIIWELGDGYRANQPVGRQNPLLQAVKDAWLKSGD